MPSQLALPDEEVGVTRLVIGMRYFDIEIIGKRECLSGVHDAERDTPVFGIHRDFDQLFLGNVSAILFPISAESAGFPFVPLPHDFAAFPRASPPLRA